MKKLLLILLIAFGMGAMAQDTTFISKWKIIVDTGDWYIKDIPINLKNIFPIITADLLFEYETECYKDTTKIIVGWKNIIDTLLIDDDSTIYTMTYPELIYKFKNEPTLKGFIKWLHKKTEK